MAKEKYNPSGREGTLEYINPEKIARAIKRAVGMGDYGLASNICKESRMDILPLLSDSAADRLLTAQKFTPVYWDFVVKEERAKRISLRALGEGTASRGN